MARRIVCAAAIAFLCSLPSSGLAQSTVSLIGTVADTSGGVLPGATVTATETSTGRQYLAVTEGSGEYRLVSMLPGTYAVQAELSGFATVRVPSVELLVGQSATLPFQLKVATLQETITVTGEAPLINTQSAVVGGNIDRRQMQELPILGRNWQDLSLLVKGVTANTTGNRGGAPRDDQFQLNVDGQQVTQGVANAAFFGQPRISREAIAEYALTTSGFDVTQGRSVGVTVQAISRSGTNDLHGSFYGNFQDDKFQSADFITGEVLPFSNQQTGFTLGGPIVQNKLHYFGTYEYERQPDSAVVNPEFWSGQPVSTLTFSTGQSQHSVLGRGDYQVSNADHISVRATIWKSDAPFTGVGGNAYPTTAANRLYRNKSVNGTWSKVISNNIVQEVKGGYTKYNWAIRLGAGVPETPFYTAAGFPNIGGTSFYPQEFLTTTPMARYELTVHAGSHDFKMGGEYLHRRDGSVWPNNTRGQFAIEGVSAEEWARRFPLDAWNDASKWDLSGLGPQTARFNVTFATDYELNMPRRTYAVWAADTWAVTDRLTVNYGLRWDLDWGGLTVPGIIDTPAIISNGFDPNNTDFGTYSGYHDTNDFAPRGGFAFQVNDGLVLRGGAGLFFATQTSNLLTGFQQQISNERRVITINVENTENRDDFLTNPLNGITAQDYLSGKFPLPAVALRNLSPEYEDPSTIQATLGFQKQVGALFGFDSDLMYARGRNLGFDRDVNQFYDPVTGFPKRVSGFGRPNPNFGSVRWFESTLKSESLRLANSFTRRLSDRWQMGGTYTLNFFERDQGTNSFGYLATGNNAFCQECEWGTTGLYQRHTIRLNGIYEAPLGFTVAAIYSFGSGTRNTTAYVVQGVAPIQTAGGFFGANRYVTGPPFTVVDQVTYPDGSVHSNYDRLVDGTPTSYQTGDQVPRNAFRGLAIQNLDVRISKSFTIPGTPVRLTGMAEAFNLFNHVNYAGYNSSMNRPTFGTPNAAFRPRTWQLAFRADF